MLRRGAEARFMPGVWVFPGGAVDREDHDAARSIELDIELDELAHRVCGARELGEEAAIALEAAALRPWSRWVTPAVVPIRFDTRFYVAVLPEAQRASHDGTETTSADWLRPAGAIDDMLAGRIIQQRRGQPPHVMITVPLLMGTDGRKMSQLAGTVQELANG